MTLAVRLPVFEGPLDLLLHLIRQAKVSIYDVPIAQITEQYLASLAEIELLEPRLASEFLLVAATLIEIKARLLLPKPAAEGGAEEDEYPRLALATLAERLIEYERVQQAAARLAEMEDWRTRQWTRPRSAPPDGLPREPYRDVSLADLIAAMARLRAASVPEQPRLVAAAPVPIGPRLREVLRTLRRYRQATLEALVGPRPSRRLVVVTFLALLELARRGRIRMRQETGFGPLTVEWVGRAA